MSLLIKVEKDAEREPTGAKYLQMRDVFDSDCECAMAY
ncbi:Uncharacterised protein [BD1-7 clade bacterium]|uniref:Uncharacterized protein n=1 Tax=BD1-7 clade bacterium TaxID=2029982 RepID=A0A5S9R0W9_9GAMM|nr:Uncharacterised protein [BD1-7 clade bacterium]